MLRHCVVIITRYCAMIALALVVGFATGVFIEVVKLKATGADVSFIWRPVGPHYQVADRAEMTARQPVAQITQPPTPDPAFKERRDARPDLASIEKRRAALRAYVGCLRRSAKELDDGKSDADTIAHAMMSSCAFEFWVYRHRRACTPNQPIRLFQDVGIFRLFSSEEADHHEGCAK